MSSNIRVNKICEFCNSLFVARTTVTRFCGDVCAKRAYKARKRLEAINESDINKRGANCAAYITAWNPLSEELNLQQNRVRNQQLLADLHHTIESNNIIRGIGKDPTGVWAGEESFLVVGISEDHIHQLALKYGQNAYVYYQLGKNAELITTSLFGDKK
jgi:hypothetical protein